MSTDSNRFLGELDAAIVAVRTAGAIIKDFYDRSTAATYTKGDGSPVTDADLAADRAIREVLSTRFPQDPILSEEGTDSTERLDARRCWIVDPVDGTEQFIQRTGEFDVLVAFVEDGRPAAVAGFQPTTSILVTATRNGGAWVQQGDGPRQRLQLAPASAGPRMATSKWFGAPGNAPIIQRAAQHLGLDPGTSRVTGFTPRMFTPPSDIDVIIGVRDGEDQNMASEWDFAVADLVFHEAGGVVTDLQGMPFRYNKPAPLNVGGLVAAVDPTSHALVLDAIRIARGL